MKDQLVDDTPAHERPHSSIMTDKINKEITIANIIVSYKHLES